MSSKGRLSAKGQMGGIGGLIALLVVIAIGAVVLYEITAAFDFSDSRTDTANATVNSTFSTIRENWENASTGDNNNLFWDNWDGHGGATTDNAVWDNKGAQPIIGARTASWTRWFQSLVLPTTYAGVTSASITGAYHLGDNSDLENLSVYVYLERPEGDNITILELENTASLFINDNVTWTSVDNTVTSSIVSGGTYTLFLQDNIDRVARVDAAGDNYRGIVWDNWTLTITTFDQGHAENVIGNVESKGDTVFNLATILAIVIVAALIIGAVVTNIGRRQLAR